MGIPLRGYFMVNDKVAKPTYNIQPIKVISECPVLNGLPQSTADVTRMKLFHARLIPSI
jgi:hypothetical protein